MTSFYFEPPEASGLSGVLHEHRGEEPVGVIAVGQHDEIVARKFRLVLGEIDALLGESTPATAAAVCQSGAKRVLVPSNHCENYVGGVPEQPVSQLVSAAAQKVKALCEGKTC